MVFFVNLYNRFKGMIVEVIGAIVVFFIYKIWSQREQISELESKHAADQAENAIQEKQGELNELHKTTVADETKAAQADSNLESNEAKLAELRRNRP